MSFSMFSSKAAVNGTSTASSSSSLPSLSISAAAAYAGGDHEPLPTSDPLDDDDTSLNNSNSIGQHGTLIPSSLTTSSTTLRKKSLLSTFYHDHCFYMIPMLGWFSFSALLSSYNKVVFGEKGKIHFPCPLFMTSIHFLAQWCCSECLCRLWPVYFGTNRVRRDMDWREWLSISIPCGLITSGDVGLSNLSMVTISLTFYTMVKASTPIFVLFWAYVFGIEQITWTLLLVVVIIAAGEYLTCLGESQETFQWHGFLLCLCASILSGARWTLVQLKLQSLEPPLKTTVVTMRLLAPSMFFSLLIISMIVERPWIAFRDDSIEQAVETLALGLLGAFFAINMVLFEFYLIMHASALLLMIGGVLKEMLTIVVGVVFFSDPINATNLSGCFVVFLGVVLYKISFHLDKEEKNKAKHQQQKRALERADSTSSSNSSYHATGGASNGTNGGVPNSSSSPMRSSPNRERTIVTADIEDDQQERLGLVHSLSKISDMNGNSGSGLDHYHHHHNGLKATTRTNSHAKESWIPLYRTNQQESGIELRRSGAGDDGTTVRSVD